MLDSRLKAYGLSAMVFAIDRLSKSIVEAHVSPFDVHPVIPGFFDIVHSQNRGVAFGLMNESNSAWRTVVLIAFSAAALLLVAGLLWKASRLDRWTVAGLALVLGGWRTGPGGRDQPPPWLPGATEGNTERAPDRQ